jgi:3-oxo-5-alpha-steroid 4-dehydrogenase 3
LIVLLNLVQSIRRLYECLYVSKFSKTAKIHIFHYLVGLFFYSTINIIPFLENYDGNFYPIRWFQPFTFLSIFIYISIKQYQTHFILSKQKKYTLPKTNLFKYVTCPHYFYESLIYLIFFLIRPSLSYALISIWVVINLSISANQSYIFYKSKNEITNEYRIFPFIY